MSKLQLFISSLGKYKCAKCSKLFPKKEIENKEFIEFNKKRRKDIVKKMIDIVDSKEFVDIQGKPVSLD